MSASTPATSPGTTGDDLRRRPAFVTTHWSVVLAAGRGQTTHSHEALSELCRTYWYPLYAYVRRRGHSPHDAQDLTQAFFACLLERRSLAAADPERGRFRSFMLASMNYFLASEWDKVRSQKRGGGKEIVSLDLAAAEQRFDLEPASGITPDKQFDQQWALALLDKVLDQLEQEYRQDDKGDLFDALKQTLTGTRESQPYATLAAQLSMNEGAIKTAVHRLRKRYRELLQREIAQTVASPEAAKEEMRHLFQALTGN